MNVGLWDPGTALSNNSACSLPLNAMCYLTQLVVSNITTETHTEHLTKLFMENYILLFGMVAILVINADSRFKNVFKDICAALGIIYWSLERGNHNILRVEKYHRFLNKTKAISGQYRCKHDVFFQNAKTSQYAWNSTPIESTNILRSVAAVSREFRFPLEVELLQPPHP